MKNILFILILFFTARIAAQNSKVNWSSFSAGFGSSASVNLSLRSITGQPLIGSGSNNTTSAGGGFFYNPNAAGIITAVGEFTNTIPSVYKLQQNYPNPFNPSTIIQYAIPTASNVKIEIFDITGEKVATLIDGFKSEGYYEVSFNANGLASGLYLYRISAGAFVQTRKMILMK
jgi:hypothetical protein